MVSTVGQVAVSTVEQVVTDDYAIYNGDSCELIKAIPDNSIHFGIHSPPFEGLYKFSNSDRDVSNNEGESFWQHYGFLISETLRITKPGRIHAVHCMQLPTSKTRHGYIGIRDFRGEIVRAYQDAGWIFHSEICIWKDPVTAQQRTKSLRLLHKQIVKDSCMSGQGLADYIVVFRKHGDNEDCVEGMFEEYIGNGLDTSDNAYRIYCVGHIARYPGTNPWSYETWLSIMIWQKYASPVWMDIDQTRTLQNRRYNPVAADERDANDEAHISPLQLDVIERCIDLWSNHGESVFTPFMGIGSEVWCAVEMGRKGIGIELKPSYFSQAVTNLGAAKKKNRTIDLFDEKNG